MMPMLGTQWTRRLLLVGGLLAMSGATARAQTVVFAPHPDDEALFASGAIYHALQAGKDVKVVIATNGDCEVPGIAHQRQLESVAAMGRLGLPSSSVIFLGYPDCGLVHLFGGYSNPQSAFLSPAGRTSTYGFEGLGNTDYHRYIFGVPALYNRPSVLQDIATVLANYRPQDIYVTSAYDDNPDHYALNFFVTEAVTARQRQDPTFQPTLHDGLVHEPCELSCNVNYHWPDPTFSPTIPFPQPQFLSQTPLLWSAIVSVPQPAVMTTTSQATNLKYLALAEYVSQFSTWLASFVRSNEFFWQWELWANLAITATPSASSSLSSATTPDRVNNGSVSGLPRRADGEWVSNGQLAGAWVQLTWPSPQMLSSVVLHDRPLGTQNITGGMLTFSDGSSVAVGALPASGAGHTMAFTTRSVTWVRFTVTSATGSAAGLAEFEVYGVPSTKLPWQPPGANFAPTISNGPAANPAAITDAATAALSVVATDVNNDALTYSWVASQGQINGNGAAVTFVPPTVSGGTTVRVDVIVADGRGGTTSGFVDIGVSPSGLSSNVARMATATASAENSSRGQTASKAIDGIVDGYPTDSTREWVAPGPLSGQWIQLTWAAAQTISSVVLHDRINTEDNVRAGTLTFSDGSSLAVGTLPNNGSGLTLNFANKTVTWVRFTVTSAVGSYTGLAEFEVFSAGSGGTNTAPVVTAGPTASPSTITTAQTSTVAVTASDADGDPLTYTWTAASGTLTGTGASLTFMPPSVATQTVVRLDVQVSDGRGGQATGFVNVTVNPVVANNPPAISSGPTATPATILDSATSTLSVIATDPNGDALTYTWTVTGGSLSGTGSSVTFTPPAVITQSVYRADVQISDGRGGVTTGSVNITVNPSNTPPIITVAPAANPATMLDTAVSNLSVTASDANGDPLTYVWSATGGTVSGAGNTATFTPPRITTQTIYRVDVTVTDGRGGSAVGSVSITVNPSSPSINIALAATATASAEAGVQTAPKAIDGVVSGYPVDSTREWAAPGALIGQWIQLAWSAPQAVYRVVLHDRINTDDQVHAGTLTFSDGSSIAVGTLPNDGAGLTLDFPSRTISWVRFTVTNAQGWNIGLAEFEVFNVSATGNTPPQVINGPTATPATITDIQTSAIAVSATDPDADVLAYNWQTNGGTVSGTGANVTFTPPRIASATTYRITVTITDGRGGAVTRFVDINVTPSSTLVNLAPQSTPTASAENTGRGQTAAKAVDGIVSGYPTNSSAEWVAPGQRAGAWIQLTWSTARSVTRVILHDRINTSDQITAATLTFSDGSSIAVGALPDNGTGLQLDFAARNVTWVRLTVTTARGENTGLAEFEVF
ncbi:MAG: PIG-L family deacetylase [Vicinamibacterales bacterium]